MLKLAWLGPPIADVDGVKIHFETRKVTAFLAYLSLNPTGIPREKLAALFWPEFDQTHAMANLRRALGSLTRSLPPGSVEADRETVRWSSRAPFEMDVLEFRVGIQAVRDHHPEDTMVCPVCLEILERAATLYCGDFLDGLNLPDCPAFDDWQYITREELKREFAWVLEKLAGGLSGQAAWDKAAGAARRWISLDRLEVNAQLALVEIYARSGQRSLAQRQVEEFTRLFKEEFGEEADDDTRALFQSALNQGQLRRAEAKTDPIRPNAVPQVLLKTKLYLPKVKPSRVSRPRLHIKLNEINQHKLTLVCAPAGFGKTSLLAEWAAQTELLTGWFSLDSGDNDPHRFLSYLCAAFDSLQEGIADNARMLLESNQPIPPQTILTVLLKDLEPVTEPLVLVLDDYQFINAQPVHDSVLYMIERSMPNLHLAIASRADPPLPLARLRAAGELLEMRTDDLRFTIEECTAFFNQVMRLDITPADIQALAARTEGWAVGLQMAAISLQDAPDRVKFIQTFSGSHRYILDYLIQEVLDRQPEYVRDFLLKTSILDRLCSELCEAVMEKTVEPAASILDYLERSNLFLIPLDQERHWYRYHHLFADLLVLQLQRFQPTIIRDLHLRASSWYEQNSQIDTAIEHALAAGAFERAGDLVEQDAQRLPYLVEFAKMQYWIDRLPPEMVLRRAWIAITQAWLWLVAGKQPALANLMDQVEENYRTLWANQYSETDRQDLLANIKSLRAYIAFFAGDLPGSITLAGEALEHISAGNDALRVRLLVQSGEVCQTNQEHLRACDFLYRGIELGIQLGDFQSATTALTRLYRSLRLLGKLTQASEITQKVIQVLSAAQRMKTPIAGKPLLCWGDLLRERGLMEDAREWLDQGLLQSRQYNIPFDIITAIVHKVKWFYSERLWDEALQLLDDVFPLLKTYSIPPPIEFSWWLWKVRVCLEKGDVQAVLSWLERVSLISDSSTAFMMEEANMLRAKLNQREGKHAEALALLDRLADEAEACGRIGNLIPILILQSFSLDAQGMKEPALDRLEKSLTLAQPEGYLATILDEGRQIGELLQALRARDLPQSLQTYTDELIRAFALRSARSPIS